MALQTAAGLTVGKLVLQLAGHLGFATINVVRRRAAVPEILELGGTEVICTEDEDLRARVAEIAGEGGVGKAIDCVAGQLGADVSRSLAPGGEMVVYGALSTHRETEADRLALPLDARSLIYGTKASAASGSIAGSPPRRSSRFARLWRRPSSSSLTRRSGSPRDSRCRCSRSRTPDEAGNSPPLDGLAERWISDPRRIPAYRTASPPENDPEREEPGELDRHALDKESRRDDGS